MDLADSLYHTYVRAKYWVRRWLGRSPLGPLLAQAQVLRWENAGRKGAPPAAVKQRLLLDQARAHGLDIFVETGTANGEMVEAMRRHFRRVYSIELSRELADKASRFFRNCPTVEIIQGDSASTLPRVIERLDGPALFWLDAHYSGTITARGDSDTPVLAELSSLLDDRGRRHAILIDDAGFFGHDPAYPSIPQLEDFVRARRTDLTVTVRDGVIFLLPV